MSSENDRNEIDVSEGEAKRLLEALAKQQHSDKLLTSRQELLTPKGKAEAEIVDSIESAAKFIRNVLSRSEPEGEGPGAMNATASYAKTQAQLAMYVLDKAMGIASHKQERNRARDVLAQVQTDAVGRAMARRLAQKQRERTRIVEAVPAVSDVEQSDTPAADSGDNE